MSAADRAKLVSSPLIRYLEMQNIGKCKSIPTGFRFAVKSKIFCQMLLNTGMGDMYHPSLFGFQ